MARLHHPDARRPSRCRAGCPPVADVTVRAAILGLGAVIVAAVLLHRRPEAAPVWSEPEDGIQPPDPRPVSILSGRLTTTAASVPMLYWSVSPDGPIIMRRQAH